MERYFLVSVSSWENLEQCRKHALAGFPGSSNGVWTYLEIETGDFLSFLYGAKLHDLYVVESKFALRNANQLGPWKPIVFKTTGKTYNFPFRMQLRPVMRFVEPLVVPHFVFVAENLFVRGGYWKTHFQADRNTLQYVRQLTAEHDGRYEPYAIDNPSYFEPLFTRRKKDATPPESFILGELILQSLARRYLNKGGNLSMILKGLEVEIDPEACEVLGEKAIAEGHVDILIKEAQPLDKAHSIVVEVKRSKADVEDIHQAARYRNELGRRCLGALLIAADFSKRAVLASKELNVWTYRYSLKWPEERMLTFAEAERRFHVEPF